MSCFERGSLGSIVVRPVLDYQIRAGQDNDKFWCPKRKLLLEGLGRDFSVNDSDMHLFGKRMSVPNDSELRRCIQEEGRNSAYAMRQGGNKLYRNLWEKLLRESRCPL